MERLYFIKDIKKSGLPCNYFDGIKKYVATGDVENNRIVSFAEIDFKSKPSRANVCVSEGDVLFAKMQNTIKVIQIDTNNSDIVYSTGFYCFNDKRILPSFLKHYFLSKTFNEQKDKRCNGATMKAINDDGMSELFIKLYSLDEQKEMIKILDSANAIIDTDKRQIELLDELVKSRFNEVFGDCLNDSEKQIELRKCTKFIDYRGKTPEKSDFGIRLFTAKNVKMHLLNFEPQEFISEDVYKRHMTRGFPKCGDVLFSTEAPLGNVCIIPHFNERFGVGQRLITIVPDKSLNSRYLEFYMASDYFQEKVWKNSSGSTVKGIKSKLLEKLPVSIPNKNTQDEFAQFAELIDKSKFNIQQHIKLMQELLDKMMCEYFGGNE